MNTVFDITKLSVIAVIGGTPLDISGGLTIEGDLITIKKENSDEVTTRRGTNQESYSANSIRDNNRLLTLKYLPSAPAVKILQAARDTKEAFGLQIKYTGEPLYSLSSDKCVFTSEPEQKISGKTGFADLEFAIRALDSIVVYG